MNRHDYYNAVGALEHIILDKAACQDTGICYNLRNAMGHEQYKDFYYFLITCFDSWPEFSGDRRYPVSVSGNPRDEYWDNVYIGLYGTGEYAMARKRLASHILSRLIGVYGNQLGVAHEHDS